MNRKMVSAVTLTLLLTSMWALAFNIHPVKASGTIYIRADGSIDPPTAPISTSDNITYTLVDNIMSDANGIVVERSNIIIDGNGYAVQCDGNGNGLYLLAVHHVTIEDMNIRACMYGILLFYSSSDNIIGSSMTANVGAGIYLYSSNNNNNVIGNNIANNGQGIALVDSCSNNSIIGNNIANNVGDGISFVSSNNNIVSGNNITANEYAGIGIQESSNNRLYHNNFVNNPRQTAFYLIPFNVWDDGYPSGGNYWSDYATRYPSAAEIDNSGLWNTPYVINAHNQDNYPLMSPWVQAENPMSVNDLWITSIEPVQTLINPSTMIPGKPTIFKVVVASTFMVEKQTHILITCSESGQPTVSWYEGPYNIMPNQETVIYTGGQQVWGQNYRPSGEFDVKIKIDAFNKVPESNEINNEFVKRIGPQNSYTFKNLGRLKVLYVPVGFWAGPQAWLLGDPKIPKDNMTREASFTDSFIRAVFPVDMNLYKSAIASEYPLPCPYFIDPWSRRVWAAAVIAELDSVIKLYHQPSMGGYDRIVLVVPDRDGELWLKYWLNKDALGMTLLQNDITGWDTVCWCQEGYWTTPAHELWHTYSHISDDTWHCSNSETGYWDYAHSRGYSGLVNGGLPMPCMMSGDDKEYGESDWAYGWICRLCYANLTNLSRFKICNDPEVLFVSGVIFDNDTVNLQPFYHFPNGYADLEPGNTGNYTLRFLDVDQQVLSDVGFNMTFESDFNVTGFGFAVPYMDGVAQIQILHGENVIVSRIVSANAPTVNLTYPNSGETFVSGENITITWEASDADNDTLSFTVLYTPDNGTSWIPIQTGVTETSLNWTVPNDHSTDQCQIKVVATDGVNTGDDLSNVMFAILRHDVAVLDITTSTNRICGGDVLPFDVTVENCGNYTETFTLEAYANTTLLQAQNVTLTSGNITTVPLTWNTSGFAEGSYVVKAYIPQVLGEVNTLDNQYAHGIVEIDSTPPTIAILSPQNKTYYSPYIPLTFETNEPVSWIAYSLNNQPNITISGNTIIDIADGTHQIIVYANDTAGNTGPSQTIHFTINSSLHDPWKSSLIGPGNYPIVDFAVYNGRFYAAADNKLYVYDKYSWNIINAPAYITSLIAHEDKLIIGARDGLYYSLDGKTMFSLIFSVPTYIKVLGSYNNTLYAGTMLDNPPKLYYCNGSAENPADWQEDTDFSAILNFSGPFGSIDSFAEYNGILYITSGGTIYSFNETDWNVANTFDDVYGFSSMKVYNSKLYLATRDQGWRKPFYQGGTGFSGRVIEFDGENWTTVLDHCYWVYSLEEYDGKLYAGTANKILTYNGTDWETSFNATEGAYYALCFENYDGKIYAGMGNGYIFADPVSEIATAAELQPSAAVPEFSSTTLALLPMILSLSAIILQQCCTDRNGDEEKPLLA